jgi:hypothetical protein
MAKHSKNPNHTTDQNVSLHIDHLLEGRPVTLIRNGVVITEEGAGITVIKRFVHTFTDLVVDPGLISLNYHEVEAVLKGSGPVLIGVGESQGEGGALRAAQLALPHLVPETLMVRDASRVLFHVMGNLDATDSAEVGDYIETHAGFDTEIYEGVCEDDTLDEVIVTIIACQESNVCHTEVKRPAPASVVCHTEARPAPNVCHTDPSPSYVSKDCHVEMRPQHPPIHEEQVFHTEVNPPDCECGMCEVCVAKSKAEAHEDVKLARQEEKLARQEEKLARQEEKLIRQQTRDEVKLAREGVKQAREEKKLVRQDLKQAKQDVKFAKQEKKLARQDVKDAHQETLHAHEEVDKARQEEKLARQAEKKHGHQDAGCGPEID